MRHRYHFSLKNYMGLSGETQAFHLEFNFGVLIAAKESSPKFFWKKLMWETFANEEIALKNVGILNNPAGITRKSKIGAS